MSARSMGQAPQRVLPPQRGIFPLDHDRVCKAPMDDYIACLSENKDRHYKCQEMSKQYLQCRMDNGLMSKEKLEQLGYANKLTDDDAKELSSETPLKRTYPDKRATNWLFFSWLDRFNETKKKSPEEENNNKNSSEKK